MTLHAGRIYLMLTIGLMAAQVADAAEPKSSTPYTLDLAVGFSQFDYQQKLDAPLTFDIARVDITAGWENTYVAVDLSRDISTTQFAASPDTGRAGREDESITLGYRLSPRLWAFAGNRDDRVTLDFTSRQGNQSRSEFYKQDGLFYGFTYTYPLQRNGILRFNVTYADLDTENQFQEPLNTQPDNEITFKELSGRRNGTSEGYQYGVTWLMPLSETLYYQARYSVGELRQRVQVDDLIANGYSVEHDSDITTRTFTMGLKMSF